jgi:type II secretory pathway component PulM
MSEGMDTADVTGGDDAENDALLRELRQLASLHDPVPPEAIAAARSAIAWRTMDAELAELIEDSATEYRSAGVRATDTPTMLSFEGEETGVELEVLQVGSTRRLLGQLVPPEHAQVEVRHAGGTITVHADEVGRFSAGDIVPGPISLRCAVGDRIVETDWFLV